MAELLDGSDHPVVRPQPLRRSEGQHRVDEGEVDDDRVLQMDWIGRVAGIGGHAGDPSRLAIPAPPTS
jgi:hypothetical protein